MAILVEEPKSRGNRVAVAIWGSFFAIIIVAVYYLFFKQPIFVELAAPVDLQSADQLSKINLKPEEVIQSTEFRNLKPVAVPTSTVPVGRSNPFLGF